MSSLFADAGRAIWIGVAMFAVGLLFLVMFKHGFAVRRQRRASGDKDARKGFLAGLVQLLFILLMLASSVAVVMAGMLLRSYKNFTSRELVARIHCLPLSTTPPRMQLTLLGDVASTVETNQFEIDGDQWTIEGNVLKWSDWLSLFGLRANYKLTRVRGRYLDTQQEQESKSSVFALSDETSDKMWSWLFRRGETLPLVQAVYGNSVYTYPDANKIFNLYVTIDGFMLETESPEGVSSR
jgi:hypothetical protein